MANIIEDIAVEISLSVDKFNGSVKQAVNKAKNKLDEAEKPVKIKADTKGFLNKIKSAVKKANQNLDKIGQKAGQVGKTMSLGLTAPLVGLGVVMFKTAADFESGMNRVQAVSGATAEEFEKLQEQAKELGRTTQFSASEAAGAMGFLAQAGFEATEILAAMPSTLQLAAAAQLDLAEAADITSNILTGYGMDVADLAKVNDVLVKAFTSTNTNLSMLGQSLKFVGPVANSAGLAFEEVAAAIGLLGNAGIQASMAGTSLRRVISSLLNPSAEAARLMKTLGVNALDSSGNITSLVDIVRQLEEAGAGAGEAMVIFGDRAGPAMASLINQGADALENMTATLRDSGGEAERVAAVQMKGLSGAFRELKSAFEGFMIALADAGALEALTNIARGVAGLIRQFTELPDVAKKAILIISGLLAATGPFLIGVSLAIKGVGLLRAAFMGLRVAIVGTTNAAVLFSRAFIKVIAPAIALTWLLWEALRAVDGLLRDVTKLLAVTEGPLQAIRAFRGAMDESERPPFLEAVGQSLGEIDKVIDSLLGQVSDAMDPLSKLKQEAIEAAQALSGALHADFPGGPSVKKARIRELRDALAEYNVKLKAAGVSEEERRKIMHGIRDDTKEVESATFDAGKEIEDFEKLVDEAMTEAGESTSEFTRDWSRMVGVLTRGDSQFQQLDTHLRGLQSRLSDQRAGLSSLQNALKDAQDEFRATTDRISEMEDALKDAENELKGLSKPDLLGQTEFEEQTFQLERMQEVAKLAENTGRTIAAVLAERPPLADTAFVRDLIDQVTAMEQQEEGIDKVNDLIRTQKEIISSKEFILYEEHWRELGKLTDEFEAPEVGIPEARTAIRNQQDLIGGLKEQIRKEGEVASKQEENIRGIEISIDGTRFAIDRTNQEIKTTQDALTAAGKVLEEFYTVKLLDADQKLERFGDNYETVVKNLDTKSRTLLDSFIAMASGEQGAIKDTVEDLLASWDEVIARAEAGVPTVNERIAQDIIEGLSGGATPQQGVDVGEFITQFQDAVTQGVKDAVPGLQQGGIITKPTLAMLGEGGVDELVTPLEGGGSRSTAFNQVFNINGGGQPASVLDRFLSDPRTREFLVPKERF